MQGALQKKQLTASFIEHFKILHGKMNITWQYDFLLSYRQHFQNVDS